MKKKTFKKASQNVDKFFKANKDLETEMTEKKAKKKNKR